jgi:hypothetical protein
MDAAQFTKMVRYAAISKPSYNKLFCIGFNKTGTTTMEKVLKLYGLDLPNQFEQESRISLPSLRGDYSKLSDFVMKYDAFQDLPFSQGETYIACDALFPNSKFILTVRDPELWFNSVVGFYSKIFNLSQRDILDENLAKNKFKYLFPDYMHEVTKKFLTCADPHGNTTVCWDKIFNKEFYINKFEERNKRIAEYFSSKQERLLVLNLSVEKDTGRLCDFLGIPQTYKIKTPHENKTASLVATL